MSWDPPLSYALLLQDDSGRKDSGNNTINVMRGALLVRLTQEEVKGLKQQQAPGFPPFNFKCLEDPSVKLSCSADVVHPLKEKQKELLHGIVKASDRCDALMKLEWAGKLTEGSSIFVNIPAFPTAAKGILRYIGSLPGKDGIKFGVELSECKYHGNNDGKFKDTRYFKCENNCGMFVGLDKISERRVTIIAKPTGGGTDSSGTKPLKKQTSAEEKMAFVPGDRVMAFDDNGGTVYGTVRWTGGRGGGTGRVGKIVGIETDVPVDAMNFGGHVTYLHHYFTPSYNKGREYQLFLPFTCILKTTIEAPIKQLPSGNIEYVPDYIREHQKTPTDSPSGTPSAKKKPMAKLSGQFDRDGDEDKSVASNFVFGPQSKPSTAKSSESEKKTPTESPITTPSATKKPSAKLSSIFDSDEDDLFGASNFGSRRGSVQQNREDQSVKRSTSSSIRLSQSSVGSSSRGEANLSEITQLRKDLETLENQIGQLGGNCDDINSTVKLLHQNVSEMERKFEKLQTQMSYNQQETEDSLKRMLANVDNAFRKALDVQKSNEELQVSNAHLRNQLTLTQQQLLGVQSMMTCSRLWVVSHDQFAIGKEISRGAWATVHETTFRGATVAAKRLHQLITAPTTRKLFQREMEMALQCQHQNIVTFLGATLEGPPVILMEMMDTSLRSAYEQGKIKDHQVLGIFYDIATALHFLHTRPDPVIHRDVSSANVLLKALYSGEWLAKLGDLGTAKLQRLTATAGPGAIIYGAPEASDASKHSPKMDVYSFGVLILETLTNTLPIENLDALKDQVCKQFPWYHQLVTSCTNHQSSDRPTMYDVIGQLDKIRKIARS